MENETNRTEEKGLLNEKDSSISVTNLLMLIGVIGGLSLFSIALYFDNKDAYLPLSSIVSVALGGAGVKAYKRTS